MLTEEQSKVVEETLNTSDSRIIAVNSIAGSGKTSTANAVIRAFNPKNGFYTAFNKAIVTDSGNRFGDLIECRTIHSLAYKYIRPKGIEDLNYNTITEYVPYEKKAEVIRILDDFFRSSSTDIYAYAEDSTEDEEIYNLVTEYAEKMLNGSIPPTFNFLLKCLHIMLKDKEISIDKDLLILDECQDTTAVTLEIFKLINADKKIIFGDKYQNIYSFMNTVNAFDLLDDLNEIKLTKSFRCNPEIARQVEEFGQQYLETNFQYKGTDSVSPKEQTDICYLSRTNNTLIERMDNLIMNGFTFRLTRPVSTIFELPLSLVSAASGREVYSKKYKFLTTEYNNYMHKTRFYKNYFDYLMLNVNDDSINSACNTLIRFSKRGINIFDVYNTVKTMKANPYIVLSTAHAFKGLEADKVYIEEDLNSAVNNVINTICNNASNFDVCNIEDHRKILSTDDKEDLNTYYVALSRAKTKLMNVGYIHASI